MQKLQIHKIAASMHIAKLNLLYDRIRSFADAIFSHDIASKL